MKAVMNEEATVLDISTNPAAFFFKYEALHQGNDLVIHNNADPKDLYYQLLGEKGNTFSWEYLEKGPELWFVKVTKHKGEETTTLGQIAASDYRKAQVFKKYGLDFSFKGNKTLLEACKEKKISTARIEREMRNACLEPRVNNVNYNYWELDFMTDFIVHNHHQYVRKSLLQISELNEKVVRMHGSHDHYLDGICELFQQVSIEFNDIMLKEEQILFPFIRFLVQVKKGKVQASCTPGAIEKSVIPMERKHEAIGEYMKHIRILSDDYTLPRRANSSYSLMYKWLNAFEDDLQQHVHLENNILFPKAIELEKEYHSNTSTFKKEIADASPLNRRRDLL